MTNIQLIKVFLASPGDVTREGEVVRKELEALNHSLGEREGVQFKVINWKTDSIPAWGNDAQTLLNDQIADMSQYDLFIGIMWNRFGTPTPRANSGTEEEFLRAVESFKQSGRPHIMFYFNQEPSTFTVEAETAQKGKVLAFKREVQNKGLTHDYHGVDDFRQSFRNHIETWLVKRESLKSMQPPHIESTPAATNESLKQSIVIESSTDSDMWVMLKTGFFIAEEVSELGDNKILLKLPVSNSDEDATLRSLQPDKFGSNKPIPYAHQNSAAIARVTEARRTSAGGKNIWEFLLTLEENQQSYLSEFNFNGISADQIAEMRARFILLNEGPPRGSLNYRSNLNDSLIWSFVTQASSRSSTSLEGNILPDLWQQLNKNPELFLPLARLWSIFHLVVSNTCQYVLELTLGPINNGKVHVKFRGQRHRQAINIEPYVINVEGICDLELNRI